MFQKTNLLKELGWDDNLIKHFMIEDNEFIEQSVPELTPEVFDTNSFTISYNTLPLGNATVVKVKDRNNL